MRVRVLDLDGAVTSQDRLLNKLLPEVHDLRRWAPTLRFGCRWQRFHRFERWLDRNLCRDEEGEPTINLLGSGDFRHLTLALLRRFSQPVNLLVLDNYAGWMRGLPFLHSANWLLHAANLPNVKRIFLVGGDKTLDATLRLLTSTSLLQSGKLVLLPAVRQSCAGLWSTIPLTPVRAQHDAPLSRDRLEELLLPHLEDLERFPLYVSLNKDVMWMPEAVVNHASGHLDLCEVQELLDFFLKASGNELVGMDILGDWSPVRTQGLLRAFFARMDERRTTVDANQARLTNERTNTMLLRFLLQEPVSSGTRRETASL